MSPINRKEHHMPAKTTKSTKAAAKTPARATRGRRTATTEAPDLRNCDTGATRKRRTAAAEAPVATKVVKSTKAAAKATTPAKAAVKKAAAKTAPVKAAAKTATTKQAAAKTATAKTARAPKPVSTERRHAMMMTLPELATAVENLANNPASVKPADRTELLLEVVRRMRERRGGRVK
jgi:hypothetical protein